MTKPIRNQVLDQIMVGSGVAMHQPRRVKCSVEMRLYVWEDLVEERVRRQVQRRVLVQAKEHHDQTSA